MKKLLITLALGIIILSGFVLVFPTTSMSSMGGNMGNMDSDCIGHCLQTTPLNMQNSVTLPLVVQIFGIFVAIILSISFVYRFDWSEEKVIKLHRLFLFDTIILRE